MTITAASTLPVIEALERAPLIVLPLVREVPPQILRRRPTPRRWSAHEHACHLTVVHQLFFDRLEQILREPHPIITPYLPDKADPDDLLMNMDLDQSLAQYVSDRARLVARIRRLTPEEWNRTAEHQEYSDYSVYIMFRHIALHDFLHAYRIEELLLKKDWSE